jgi:DNA-nicking Smr family endonuclease
MRRLSADDLGLWRRAMRDVAPLPGRGRESPLSNLPPLAGEGSAQSPRVGTDAGEMSSVRKKTVGTNAPVPPLDRFAGVDRATAERVKRGRRPIEARLDLHGMTQAEAHSALARFVSGSSAAGRRCVLVITGHGRFSGGILKQAVPRWLNEPGMRRHLLAIAPAQPQHGGAGALYVLLRRMRNPD